MIYRSFSASGAFSVSILLSSLKKILIFLYLSLSCCVWCLCIFKAWTELIGIVYPLLDNEWVGPKIYIYITQPEPMRVRSRLLLLHWEDSNILLSLPDANPSQLSKHVKHFNTSVLLQMLFHFLNEWWNPSVLPYVILAWIPQTLCYHILLNKHELTIPYHWLFLSGEAHWLKPPTLARHQSNHLH